MNLKRFEARLEKLKKEFEIFSADVDEIVDLDETVTKTAADKLSAEMETLSERMAELRQKLAAKSERYNDIANELEGFEATLAEAVQFFDELEFDDEETGDEETGEEETDLDEP